MDYRKFGECYYIRMDREDVYKRQIINTAWSLGVRRYVTELWDVGKENWKEDICFANQSMRTPVSYTHLLQRKPFRLVCRTL